MMKIARVQSWYSTNAVTTPMPEIVLKPRKESVGSNREVWQEQLNTPLKSEAAALDEPPATPDFLTQLFPSGERREETLRTMRNDETAIHSQKRTQEPRAATSGASV